MAAPTATATTNLSGATGPTAAVLVRRVLNRMEDDAYTDTHSDAPTAIATSITVATDATSRYEIGDTLDWADDGSFEAALVTATAATALTIRRGHRGTTAATHAAAAVFRKNPRFLSQIVSEVTTEAIQSLWPDIYLVRESTYTLPSVPYDRWYALPAGTQDVLDVYQYDTTSTPPVQVRPATRGQVTFFDTTNITTGLGFTITGLTDTGDIHVINTAKVDRASLTATQTDIVVTEAIASLLEIEQARPSRREDPAVFDSVSRIRLLRSQARQMRSNEKQRLQAFLPRRDEMLFRQRKHYYDGVLQSTGLLDRP